MWTTRLACALIAIGGILQGSSVGSAQTTTDQSPSGWQTLKIGAGGFIRGIDIQCDQGYGRCRNSGTTTKVVRADVYGAYVWTTTSTCQGSNVPPPCWQELITDQTLPVGDPMNNPFACPASQFTACSPYEIRIAPNDTNIAYMMYNGYVYKTANLRSVAPKWTRTGFAQDKTSNPNDNYSQFGPKIAIDPANAANLIVCTEGAGCFGSANGGNSFSAVKGITNATSAGMLVVFDPSSISGDSTPNFYISSYGTGVYKCTGGAAAPACALTANTPRTHCFMTVDARGRLYLVANNGASDQTLYIYSSGGWSSVTVGSNGNAINGVAIDPSNPDNVTVQAQNGEISYSTNGARSFSGYGGQAKMKREATDIPWLAWTNEQYMSAGQIIYDPAQSNVLYFSEGIGVWYTNPSARSSVTWVSQNTGIEELVGQDIISPWGCMPVCKPVTLEGDRPTFYVGNPDAYPSTHGGANPQARAIVWGHGINWATGSPNTIVIDAVLQGDGSGISADGGQTWKAFSGSPAGYPATYFGGGIAAGSSNVYLWALARNGELAGTADGGKTWTTITGAGISEQAPYGWQKTPGLSARVVTSDRVNANTFYVYNGACDGSSSLQGIYRVVYSGGSWTVSLAKRGKFDIYVCGWPVLKSVPGNAGEMFYTSGQISSSPRPNYAYFYDCQDTAGTIACKQIDNVLEVWAFGFGAAKPGGDGFPSIYIAGFAHCGRFGVNGCPTRADGYVWGIWRSTDHGATWNYLGIPLNSLDTIQAVEGDANTYGEVYIAFVGSGFAYGRFN